MDDIVAIKIITKDKRETGFLTFGRIFDPVDETELLEVVKTNSSPYEGLRDNIESMEVCWSLRDAAHMIYFYEAFRRIIQIKIPFGNKYDQWKEKMKKEMREGDHLYYLGIERKK